MFVTYSLKEILFLIFMIKYVYLTLSSHPVLCSGAVTGRALADDRAGERGPGHWGAGVRTHRPGRVHHSSAGTGHRQRGSGGVRVGTGAGTGVLSASRIWRWRTRHSLTSTRSHHSSWTHSHWTSRPHWPTRAHRTSRSHRSTRSHWTSWSHLTSRTHRATWTHWPAWTHHSHRSTHSTILLCFVVVELHLHFPPLFLCLVV